MMTVRSDQGMADRSGLGQLFDMQVIVRLLIGLIVPRLRRILRIMQPVRAEVIEDYLHNAELRTFVHSRSCWQEGIPSRSLAHQ